MSRDRYDGSSVRSGIDDAAPASRKKGRRGSFRFLALLVAAGTVSGFPIATVAPPPAQAAQSALRSPAAFPGPILRGPRGPQTPQASQFRNHCNSYLDTQAEQIGSTSVPTGTALWGESCGAAVLYIDNPGSGHFHAMIGVANSDTSGNPAEVRVRAVGSDGYDNSFVVVKAARSAAVPIDMDFSNSSALEITFPSNNEPKTVVWDFHLSGAAWTVASAAFNGNALPAGARPIDVGAISRGCNAYQLTDPISATLVTVPANSGLWLTACGTATFTIPSPRTGTLVLRFGTTDDSVDPRSTLAVRVLDANGQIVRKVMGVALLGDGLAPLWVDVGGGTTVQITVDCSLDVICSTSNHVVITALGILPGGVSPYAIHDRLASAHSPNRSVVVSPDAFVSKCNSSIGTSDTSVAQHPVYALTYFATYSCGSSSLIFCCTPAVGTFYAKFGVPDTASATGGAQPSMSVTVKDKDNHVLRSLKVRAQYGTPGTPVAINIDEASVLSFAFDGNNALLYDMRLKGTATISDLFFPPSVPPVFPRRGVAISPGAFTRQCNAYVGTTDLRLVGATTLEGWSLYGLGCGEADLTLSGSRHRWTDFYARVGFKIAESPAATVVIRLNVVDRSGKSLRHYDKLILYGYGTQPVHVSLAGGAVLQIQWLNTNDTSVIYAMTGV